MVNIKIISDFVDGVNLGMGIILVIKGNMIGVFNIAVGIIGIYFSHKGDS